MDRLKLTGLWKNTDRKGDIYYAGSLSPGVRILIFKNSYKKEAREPDLILYVAPAEKKGARSESADPHGL